MSKIQKAIIPRNWLFGRLAYISGNLRNLAYSNSYNFTVYELAELIKAEAMIARVIRNKKQSSEEIKTKLKQQEK